MINYFRDVAPAHTAVSDEACTLEKECQRTESQQGDHRCNT